MGGLDDLIQHAYQEVESNASALDNVLTGGFRTPPKMPSATGKFQNGRDLTRPPGEPVTVNAPPATAGKATVVIDDSIEFLHFGTVYLDRASAFVHGELDDSDPELDLGSQLGGHAIMYRAALEREAILLAGAFSAHMAALAERDTDEGTVGQALAVVGNLLGGGGGMGGKAEPADLNPYVTKAQAIGKQIDVDPITYDVTHQAGIDLHDLRASYCAYLDQELGKGAAPPPDAGLIAGIPLLSKVLPPEIGKIFTMVEKMTTKAFDIYVKVVVGLTRTMMPVIETACRDISVDAITGKKVPIFSVWLPPPDAPETAAHLINAPAAPPQTGIGPVDAFVGQVMGKVDSVINDVDAKADPVVDFLSRPGKPAPGGPFLDEVFSQLDDGSGYLKTAAGVEGMGHLVRTAVEQAFGFEPGGLPGFVEGLVDKVCGVHADFLRGVYGVLVGLDPTKPIVEADLITAGRAHLVTQLIEAVAHSLTFLDKLRSFKFNLDLFGPIEKTLSGEALFQRGVELVNEELGPHLDPLVTLLMKHFAAALESARQEAQPGMTMEVYLARLPSLYALLFRKTFFPLWDLLVQTVFKPVSDLLDPMVGRVEDLAKKAQGIVDTVRTGLLRASKVIHTALTQGIQGGLAGTNLGQYADDLKAVLPPGAKPPSVTAAATTFPVPERKTKGAGTAIDDAMRAKVDPSKRWQDPPPAASASPQAQPAAA